MLLLFGLGLPPACTLQLLSCSPLPAGVLNVAGAMYSGSTFVSGRKLPSSHMAQDLGRYVHGWFLPAVPALCPGRTAAVLPPKELSTSLPGLPLCLMPWLASHSALPHK